MTSQANHFNHHVLLIVAILVTSLLAGCSDGSGVKVTQLEPVSGKFKVVPIKGLSYSTQTLNGVTNDDGEYLYRPGEEIEFSVGSIVLGKMQAKEEITLFDLYDVVPPADQVSLQTQLRTYAEVDDFDRVANIAFFLSKLNNNHNPRGSGFFGQPADLIDLSAWNEKLAHSELSFEHDFYEFSYSAFSRFAGLHREEIASNRINFFDTLEYLYRTSDLTISTLVPSSTQYFEGEPEVLTSQNTYGYDEVGRQVQFKSERFGTSPYVSESLTINLDDAIEAVSRFDSNGDGVFDRTNSNITSFDEMGRTIFRSERIDIDGDGLFDYINSNDISYDSGSTIDTYKEDEDGDGAWDEQSQSRSSSEVIYEGDSIYYITVTDRDDDFDQVYERSELSTETLTFDEKGHRIIRTRERDDNNDGTLNYRAEENSIYLDNRLESRVTQYDTQADGVLDLKTTFGFLYDQYGNIVTVPSTHSQNGLLVSTRQYDYTYDQNLQVTSYRFEWDRNVDGISNWITDISVSYDEFGNRTLQDYYNYQQAPGSTVDKPERFSKSQISYVSPIQIKSKSAQADRDGDGIYEGQGRSVHYYTEVPNGLWYIVYEEYPAWLNIPDFPEGVEYSLN